MKTPVFTACLILFAALASPVAAETARAGVQDAIIAQLTDQGFTHIRVSNTFLGRVRIFATSPKLTREIIFNPRTGEILRDYWDDDDDDDDAGGGLVSPIGAGGPGGGGSGSQDDDRDDDRDDGRDDDRDDGSDDDDSDDDEDDDDSDDDSDDDDEDDD